MDGFRGGFLIAFEWKCVFGKQVIAGRDGFRVVGRGTELELGYEKIHEARFVPEDRRWRRMFGPLLILEPLWPFQQAGDGTKLVIMHAREPLELRSDEYEGLAEFADTLRRRNVPGLATENHLTQSRRDAEKR